MADEAPQDAYRSRKTSENNTASNLIEFRDMVDEALNIDVCAQNNSDNTSLGEQTDDRILSSAGQLDDEEKIDLSTAMAVSELPPDITESFNAAAEQLSSLCGHVARTPPVTQLVAQADDEDAASDEKLASPTVEPPCENLADTASSTCPKPTTDPRMSKTADKKRHIMISYNCSSRETCRKIYDRLVEKDYKVWMDVVDMHDKVLRSMARAIENSYIVLLCINQQYYESAYCQMEAVYAAEKRIKFIPCLMEKDFRAESWLGIIKGDNVHVDFSEPEKFDESFEQLIRQINYVETRLSIQPRRSPVPGLATNPMVAAAAASFAHAATSTTAQDINSRRFDDIIGEYKRCVKKKRHQISRLKRSELSDLIVKLRQELFTDSEKSDDETELKTDQQFLQELLRRSLDQNEALLTLVDRLTTPQPMQQPNVRRLDMDGVIKVILAVMLLWTLNVLCQKEK